MSFFLFNKKTLAVARFCFINKLRDIVKIINIAIIIQKVHLMYVRVYRPQMYF